MQIPRARLGILCALMACAVVLGATSAAKADPPRREAQREARSEAPTTYSFEDDQVLGDTTGPIGEVLQVRRRPQRESLIRARDAFVRELLKSVEAL